MKFTLGYSPCPNDTFIFDALVNHKIDTEGFEFEAVLEDVETLNKGAFQEQLSITKLSFPAFFQASGYYQLLNSGSALGKGVGPLLISAHPLSDLTWAGINDFLINSKIAIPGANTTANLLLTFAFPEAMNRVPMIFSAIEDAVQSGAADVGLIIHENRFTYAKRGLQKVIDLGEYWEEKTKTPIPLGGIAIHRKHAADIRFKVDRLVRKSLEYAFSNYPLITDYVKTHSQTLSEEVMRQHIDLYVNNFSLDLGEEGKAAIMRLRECFDQLQPSVSRDRSSPLFL